MKLKPNKMLMVGTAMLPGFMAAQQANQRPNIMLILVDDMGYSDLGCFGGEINTPNIDGMAEQGIRFTQFFNSGRSCPSRAQLLTGLYAQQTGIMGMGQSLNKKCVTIPEVLKTAGYNTAMAGKWHLSLTQSIGTREQQTRWLSHQDYFGDHPFAPLDTYPCNRGFDEHWGTIWGVVNHFDPFSLVHNETPIFKNGIPADFYSTDYITQKSIDMLDDLTKKDEPFFMYVAYNAPHWPLHAKPQDIAKYKGKYDEGWDVMRERRYKRMQQLGILDPNETPNAQNESGRAWKDEHDKALQAANMEVHAAMVDCVDQGVGRILQKLRETGALDNTIIIFSSDNGASPENYNIGEFDRHDRTRSGEMVTHNSRTPGGELSYNYLDRGWAGAVNAPFRYWKAESFHGGTAAPTIVYWPKEIKNKGGIVKAPCHFIDIMPTCIDIAQASYPITYKGHDITPLPTEARNLMPIINGETTWRDERTLFWEHEGGRAIRVGDWRMTALRNGAWQLFDLKHDYSETTNLAAEHPDKVKEMKKQWNNWAKSVGLSVKDDIADTPKELVFYYPFDDNLDDKGPHHYQLTPHGYSLGDGKYGSALYLDGNAQYLDFNTTGTIETKNTQFTVCAWVYDEQTAVPGTGSATQDGAYFRDEVILAQKDNAGTGRIVLYGRAETPTGGGDTRYFYNSFLGGTQSHATNGSLKRGKWQHVAAVCNPADQTVTYYIDGIRDATVTTKAFEACKGGFRIGGHKAGKDYWKGRIDELYLFRGLLSADEIRTIRDNKGPLTGIEGTTTADFRLIYDSPSSTLCSSNGYPMKSLTLHSVSGQTVLKQANKSAVSLHQLPKGIYIASAIGGKGQQATMKIEL